MNWPENHAGIGNGRLRDADQTNAAAKAYQSHQAVPANRPRLDDRMKAQLRHLLDNIVVDFRPWIRIAYNEAFGHKLRPFNHPSCSESVIVGKRDQDWLGPERFDNATRGRRISYNETEIHLKRANVAHVHSRRPLYDLQVHIVVRSKKRA